MRKDTINNLLQEPLRVVNIGLEGFTAYSGQSAPSFQ